MDGTFAKMIEMVREDRSAIYIAPAGKQTRMIAINGGLCDLMHEEVVLDAPLVQIEQELVRFLQVNGWTVRLNGGEYVARRSSRPVTRSIDDIIAA